MSHTGFLLIPLWLLIQTGHLAILSVVRGQIQKYYICSLGINQLNMYWGNLTLLKKWLRMFGSFRLWISQYAFQNWSHASVFWCDRRKFSSYFSTEYHSNRTHWCGLFASVLVSLSVHVYYSGNRSNDGHAFVLTFTTWFGTLMNDPLMYNEIYRLHNEKSLHTRSRLHNEIYLHNNIKP